MIYLYSGTPGSGKSLHVALDILKKLRRQHDVIANFTVNINLIQSKFLTRFNKNYVRKIGNFTYVDNSEMTVKYLLQYAYKNHKIGIESQTLLVIDECAVMFNCREYGKSDRLEWIKFFQQHRKLGYNVILISQNDRLIDRQIRAFIEYDVKHRKANNFGNIGIIFTLLHIKLFVAVTYWYGVKEKCSTEFFTFQSKISKLYDTYKMFDNIVPITDETRGNAKAGGSLVSSE